MREGLIKKEKGRKREEKDRREMNEISLDTGTVRGTEEATRVEATTGITL